MRSVAIGLARSQIKSKLLSLELRLFTFKVLVAT